jgi:hypothetical protein
VEITTSANSIWRFCLRTIGCPELHSGQHDFDYNYKSNNQRNCTSEGLWRRLQKCKRKQCDSQWRYQRSSNDILRDRQHQALQFGGGNQKRWCGPANGHHQDDYNQLYHKFLVCLLTIGCCFGAKAQEGGTTAIANPVATSTGSVSNQAVQINQGGYSQQGFGVGHTCNSSTLVMTPFYLGNDVNNPEASYIRNQNFGAQISLSIPLDGSMAELCKQLARKKIEKERLDYELVRVLKCAELQKMGYMIRPESQFYPLCSDVISIAAYQKSLPSSPSTSEPSQQPP